MADTKIDKSLDDIIKERNINVSRRGGGSITMGGRGRGAGRGGAARGGRGGAMGRRPVSNGGVMKRRSAGGSPNKSANINGQWGHDMYGNGSGGRRSAQAAYSVASAAVAQAQSAGPAKLVISNLEYGVNDNDIKGLFQEFGSIRKAAVHYDRSGRSLGTADVIFDRRADGVRALKKYNGVSLDGRPMNIQFAAELAATVTPMIIQQPRAFQQNRVGGGGGGNGGGRGVRNGRGNGGGGGRGGAARGARGGAGAARGGAREKKPERSAADLDADLDAYSKMQTD